MISLHSLLSRIAPLRALTEDGRRREFIFNVLIAGSLCLLFVAVLLDGINLLFGDPVAYAHNSLSFLVNLAILAFFFGLYLLSRSGRMVLGSYVLIGLLYALATYLAYAWGFDLPAASLFYVLTIVMAGILISTRFAFAVTGFIGVSMGLLAYCQLTEVLPVSAFWKDSPGAYTDVVMTVILFLIIATVSWLSNREIERSLVRARRSEAELKQERDTLEIRIQERTEELRKAELERMSQAYKFVEFGRLAGSIFHDLANPLTALSLNLDSIAKGAEDKTKLARMADDIERARGAAAHMQKLMSCMKKHLAHEGEKERFSLHAVLTEAAHVLSSYARARNVSLRYESTVDAQLYGDPVAFMQVVTNIVSNAIESFPPNTGSRAARLVTISVSIESECALLRIHDTGPGISAEILERMFEPFFSTKSHTGGLGIGLSLAKRVLEKDFGGRMQVESTLGDGTVFALYFSLREP